MSGGQSKSCIYYLLFLISVLEWTVIQEGEAFSILTKAARNFFSHKNVDEAYMGSNELILRYGYSLETHYVETEDGYILTLFRIPPENSTFVSQTNETSKVPLMKNATTPEPVSANKTKGSILLLHGYICSSDVFLLQANKSFAFMLADAGYDVWLGNARGTKYSGHKKLWKHDIKYWDYSYHEIGKYDVPAMINHVLKETGESQLDLIGQSMGATTYFVAMDLYPELQKKIKNAVLLAPIAYICNMKSPVKFFDHLSSSSLESIFKSIAGGRTFPRGVKSWLNDVGPAICTRSFATICWHYYAFLGGPNPKQFDQTIIHKAIGHVPADSASRLGIHYLQGYDSKQRNNNNSCEFRRYDFGVNENLKVYGSKRPPAYNLSAINVPTFVMYGEGDWLSVPKDVKRTVAELQNVKNVTIVQDRLWSHFDFVFGKDASTLVYKVVINFLDGSAQ